MPRPAASLLVLSLLFSGVRGVYFFAAGHQSEFNRLEKYHNPPPMPKPATNNA
jgi:hypothetical protein